MAVHTSVPYLLKIAAALIFGVLLVLFDFSLANAFSYQEFAALIYSPGAAPDWFTFHGWWGPSFEGATGVVSYLVGDNDATAGLRSAGLPWVGLTLGMLTNNENPLTKAEKVILGCLVNGMNDATIAAERKYARRSIKWHVSNIRAKLRKRLTELGYDEQAIVPLLKTRDDVALTAIQQGWIHISDTVFNRLQKRIRDSIIPSPITSGSWLDDGFRKSSKIRDEQRRLRDELPDPLGLLGRRRGVYGARNRAVYKGRAARPTRKGQGQLTNRQREVLEFITRGFSNKEIAKALKIRENTVRNHVHGLFGNLGVSSRTEAVREGIKRDLIRITSETETDVESLLPRELEVLRLIADGLTNKEIADELIISESTVKGHVSAILRKLDVSNRAEAAVKVLVDRKDRDDSNLGRTPPPITDGSGIEGEGGANLRVFSGEFEAYPYD